jgi:hypothetical protein
VVLGLIAGHPTWGIVALPLLARIYVRRKDLGSIDPSHPPAFKTELELAADLMRWAATWLGFLGYPYSVGCHAYRGPFSASASRRWPLRRKTRRRYETRLRVRAGLASVGHSGSLPQALRADPSLFDPGVIRQPLVV